MRVNPVVVCALLCSVLYVSPAGGYSAQQQFFSLSCAGTMYFFRFSDQDKHMILPAEDTR